MVTKAMRRVNSTVHLVRPPCMDSSHPTGWVGWVGQLAQRHLTTVGPYYSLLSPFEQEQVRRSCVEWRERGDDAVQGDQGDDAAVPKRRRCCGPQEETMLRLQCERRAWARERARERVGGSRRARGQGALRKKEAPHDTPWLSWAWHASMSSGGCTRRIAAGLSTGNLVWWWMHQTDRSWLVQTA